MVIKNMKAIEYNMFMTMIKLLTDRVPTIAREYGIKGKEIPILPTYPSDLTAIQKPSIIMRKVSTEQSKVGFGNVLGQFYDTEIRGYTDVVGKEHDIWLQFDIVTANNSDRLLLESILTDDVFGNIEYNDNGTIKFFDFTKDINNPTETGRMKLVGNTTIYDMHEEFSTNNYYIGSVRRGINIIQTVIPEQEYVDLSKWIKQTYKIIV